MQFTQLSRENRIRCMKKHDLRESDTNRQECGSQTHTTTIHSILRRFLPFLNELCFEPSNPDNGRERGTYTTCFIDQSPSCIVNELFTPRLVIAPR